ncbi:18.5 kDa class I heat shock protein-like [Malus sylvestris]|uniref:18.5 kDa class I heat shock protein-like n=1 Tax=Malus sylvestris TaxID=3752 RepID=UPI0021AD2819|nr:18.5 kDa class I heat shock protein-like [Malus sylvestris]
MALSHLGGRRNNVFDPFSLDIWDPFEGFGALANIPSSARETTAIANTRIDWKETPEAYIFKAYIVNKHLPGIKKEDVRLEVEDKKVLQIPGPKTRLSYTHILTNGTSQRVERSSGKLMGKVRLLENVKVDQVKAEMKAWVLIVTLPKEVKTPNVERIEIIEA